MTTSLIPTRLHLLEQAEFTFLQMRFIRDVAKGLLAEIDRFEGLLRQRRAHGASPDAERVDRLASIFYPNASSKGAAFAQTPHKTQMFARPARGILRRKSWKLFC